VKKQDLRSLMADLAVVKKAVLKSRGILHSLYNPVHLRLMGLLFGIAIFVFCGVLARFIAIYGGYHLVPAWVRTVFWLSAAFGTLAVGLLKHTSLWKAFKSLQPGSPFAAMYREIFNLVGVNHVYLGLLAGILFLAPFLSLTGHSLFLVPVLSVIAGLALNGVGSTFKYAGYLLMGYLLIFSGLMSLLFLLANPLAGICLTFGVASLIFGGYGYIRRPDGGKN